jgi:hypothetical protein
MRECIGNPMHWRRHYEVRHISGKHLLESPDNVPVHPHLRLLAALGPKHMDKTIYEYSNQGLFIRQRSHHPSPFR